MVAADSYDNILEYLFGKGGGSPYMCGLLFAPGASTIGKAIYERFLDWHYRSGKNFIIFCVGYGSWKTFPDQKPVALLPGPAGCTPTEIYYNPSTFNNVRRTVQSASAWRYSGEADLLLVNVVHLDNRDVPMLDFENMIASS